ncbi:putative transcription factor bZIP family [Helianthus annuus]|nr:putative transcription factor bZIP family [Helianthus annuus]KAJ0472988.1 putative transcription factor bZIP family [Helianthus annuus]KAJ0648592.1 putative transcription factor bZIP family [Helianthus annuus]
MSENKDIQRVQSSFGDPLESHVSFDHLRIPQSNTVQFRAQIQPFVSYFNAENSGKRLGIPPAHPQILGTRSPRSNQQTSSQPLFFSVDSLPPLSPSSYRGPTSDQIVGDVTHRRSNSDIPFGFSTILQSSPPLIPLRGSKGFDVSAHLRNIKQESNWEKTCGESNAEGLGERKSEASGTKANGGDSSDNEATSSVIGSNNSMQRSGICSISDKRHYRSLSMDSVIGNMNFVDESLKLPEGQIGKLLSADSINVNSDTFSLDFGNGVFNGAELKKIMANENLAEMALTDPKRVKRILANRQSAARSKERKMRYITELENKVQNLQTEATTLSAQVTLLQRDLTSLTSQNNELKFRVQAMEQQSHLRDALNDTLTAEVQRLKIMRLELSADATNFSQPSINLQMFQLHHQHEQQEQNGGTTTHG